MASSRSSRSAEPRRHRTGHGWLVLTAALLTATLLATEATAQNGNQPSPQEPAPPQAKATALQGVDDPAPTDVAKLFAMFRSLRQLRASYTEKKHLALLAVPLQSRGQLCYLKSGYLSRIVTAPAKARLTITPTELRMQDAEGSQVVDLRQSERVRLFVTSLLQVFRGDHEALQKVYRIRFLHLAKEHTASQRWQLELVPAHEQLQAIVKRLVLHGRGRAVTRIELVEPNGDRTVTTIVSAKKDAPFTNEERRELFGIADDAGETEARAPKSADGGEDQATRSR